MLVFFFLSLLLTVEYISNGHSDDLFDLLICSQAPRSVTICRSVPSGQQIDVPRLSLYLLFKKTRQKSWGVDLGVDSDF